MKQLDNEVTAGILLIRKTHKDAIPKTVRLGELLTWCKNQPELGDHGKWMAFMKNSLPFSQQSASNYMRVYELSKEGKLPEVDSLSDLYFLLGIEHEDTRESLVAESKRTGKSVRAVNAGRMADLKQKAIKKLCDTDISMPNGEPKKWVDLAKGDTVEAIVQDARRLRELSSSGAAPKDSFNGAITNSATEPNNAESPRDQSPAEEVVTKEMWKIWRNQKIRESILNALGRMQKVLDTDKANDLDILRYMVDVDLRRVINKLECRD